MITVRKITEKLYFVEFYEVGKRKGQTCGQKDLATLLSICEAQGIKSNFASLSPYIVIKNITLCLINSPTSRQAI